MATELPVKNAPKESAKVQRIPVKVPAPFKEGYSLRQKDADALNAYYVNCVRNAIAPRIAKLVKQAGGEDKVDAKTIQAEIDNFVLEYDFGMGGGRTADPVEHEMMEIARNLVRKAIEKKGGKVSDYKAKDISEQARKLTQHDTHGPKIRAQAEKIVQQRESLEDIDI